ncbi:MAG: Ig-like domain-containing protein [Stagnimonas sp.]|nr:Ig-like domain-containing protein [Stagnimonas sp.]
MKTTNTLFSFALLAVLAALSGCDSTSADKSSPISVGGTGTIPGTGNTGGTGGGTTGGTTTGGITTPPVTGGGTGTTTPINTPPIALPDVAVVQIGSTGNPVNVLANDSDANGDNLTITAASLTLSVPPNPGSVVAIAANGKSLRYTPPTGFIGAQTLRYTISDGKGGVASALAVITVSPLALPSAALPDVFTKLVDAPVSTLVVLANDVDGAGGGLVVTTASSLATVPPSNAGVVSVVDGALRYQPKPGFVGVETLSYTLMDANGATATAPVVVTVLPLAAPPVALPDVATLAVGASSDLDVLANDVDLAGGGLTLTAVTPITSLPPGGEGLFTVVNNRVRYVPTSESFIGTQTASYSLIDQNGSTGTGLITIVVTPALPTVPPLAVPDVAMRNTGATTFALDVLANDIDVAGGGLTITAAEVLLGLPSSTGIAVTTNGSVLQLALPATYAGVLTLSYTITDANGATATTAAVVTVAPSALPAVPPVPLPDLATLAQDSTATAIDVLVNDVDPAGGGLTLTAASVLVSLPPAAHTVAVVGNRVQFTPAAGFAGVVTVSYTVTDANGATGTGLLTITVVPAVLVALPAAVGDVGSLVVTLLSGSTGSFDVLANDIDPAGGGLTLQNLRFQNPLLATVGSVLSIVGNRVQLTVPLLGLVTGVLPIEYTAVDSLGRTVTGVLNVTLLP